MRTGEAIQRRQRGFTYLWLLFVLALGGAVLAALGTQWSTVVRRDREIELEFRGHQIADALGSYARASPEGVPSLPMRLEELLEDRRSGAIRRHLRRLYVDPYTQQADWDLITDTEGHILGVHSVSDAPALRTAALPASLAASAAPARVSDKKFMATLSRPANASSSAADAASAAASATRP